MIFGVVSQNWGYLLEGPYEDYNILVSILGFPSVGKLPDNPCVTPI